MKTTQIKRMLLMVCLCVSTQLALACDVCKKQQPKVLQGITHGTGPQSNWDYVIVLVTCLLVVACMYSTIRTLLFPKEASSNHIKYSIFNTDSHGSK